MNPNMKTLMGMVGGEDRYRNIAKEVRENAERLNGCARHDFRPDGPETQLGVRYHCASCRGHIDAVCYRWYRTGMEQGVAA